MDKLSCPIEASLQSIGGKAEDLKSVFKRFDISKCNELHPYEFQVALEALGFKPNNPIIEREISCYKETQSRITYQEFEKFVSHLMEEQNPMDEILSVFEIFDVDKKNKISLTNLEKIAEDLGENITTTELQGMIDEFDEDGDGQINLKEFLSIMMEKDKQRNVPFS